MHDALDRFRTEFAAIGPRHIDDGRGNVWFHGGGVLNRWAAQGFEARNVWINTWGAISSMASYGGSPRKRVCGSTFANLNVPSLGASGRVDRRFLWCGLFPARLKI
jgi:hypothetical protein